MNKSRVAAIAAFISLSISSTAQASCWLPEERDAAQVRALQTMLMVGTLHCRARDSYIAAAYDRFVSKHRVLLDEQNGVLQAHFARENKENARAAYDRYNTAVANQYAQHDFGSEDLCWSIASLAEQAEETDSRDLLSLAGDHTLPPSDASCRPTEALARPARPPLPAIKAAPEPVEVPVTVAAAEPEPARAPAPAVQVVAARTGAPEQPAQSREEALKLAIAALQAATAALEAAAETPEMPAVPAGEVSKIELLEEGGPGNK